MIVLFMMERISVDPYILNNMRLYYYRIIFRQGLHKKSG